MAGKRQGGMFLLDHEISCVSQNSSYKEFLFFWMWSFTGGDALSAFATSVKKNNNKKRSLHSFWIAFQAGCIWESQPGYSERQPVDNSIVLWWVIVLSWCWLLESPGTLHVNPMNHFLFNLFPFSRFLYNFHMAGMMQTWKLVWYI